MAVKTVSRNRPCPICGKTDWCGFFESRTGGEMVCCQRSEGGQNVIGYDGRNYVFITRSKTGSSAIYEEEGQNLAKEKEWKEQNGISGENRKRVYADKAPMRQLTPVDIIEPSEDHVWLDKCYNTLLDELVLEEKHRKYLLEEGWSNELIDRCRIKSLPEEDYKRIRDNILSKNPLRVELGARVSSKIGDLSGVPGFYQNKKGKWTIAGAGGILFPLFDESHNVFRLRVRLDHVSKGGKYRNLSSYHENEEAEKQGFLMNVYYHGCRAGNNIGFYYDSSRDDMYCAYITEGEKKSILGEEILRAPFINIPGVNSVGKLVEGEVGQRPVDFLKKMGIKILIIAFDADFRTNHAVYLHQQRAISILKEEGFTIGLAEWDESKGKGIDDLLVGNNSPDYHLVS